MSDQNQILSKEIIGRHVRLEQLGTSHIPGLVKAGADPTIWDWMACDALTTIEEATTFVENAHAMAATGSQVPFAIIDQATGEVVGSTRFMNIEPAHKRLEIGWTWLTPRVHRTAINTECKLLLLTRAFEEWGALRVEFKTDHRNLRSQTAIARLGAVREGVLRAHVISKDGSRRDSVYFSILKDEWPTVCDGLTARLRR